MEQIFLVHDLPKETVTVIMMLYRSTKVKVRSPDGDTNFFDIVVTLAPYLFIICLDYILKMLIDLIKENGFTLKKARSRRYPVETIMDVNYADNIALLANTQAKSQLPSLEEAADGIGHHVNADKTKYMSFDQEGAISILNGGPLKFYGSSISFTESNVIMHLMKAGTTIHRLSIIWKSDVFDKIKKRFLPSSSCVNPIVGIIAHER